MKQTLKFLPTVIILTLILLISGCRAATSVSSQNEEGIIIERGEPVTIAVSSALGFAGIDEEGLSILNAAELAAQDFGGEINGHPIRIVGIDSGCEPDAAAAATDELLARPEIVGVVGHMCSSGCISSLPAFSETGISVISPGCEAGSLTDPISHASGFLRTMYDGQSEALVTARFMYTTLGARKIAVINDPGPNDDELIEDFLGLFEALGGENVLSVNDIIYTSEWVNQFFADCLEKDVDVIYAPLEPFNSLFFIIHREYIENRIPIVGSHRLVSNWFLRQIDQDIDGIYAAGPAPKSPEMHAVFSERYLQSYGTPPPSPKASISYDATVLLLEAIRNVAIWTSQTSLTINRQELNEQLYLMTSIQGANGSLTCTEWGQCSGVKAVIYQVNEGAWQVVYSP